MATGPGASAAGWSCKKTVSGAIDARFLGLLLMLRKKLKGSGANPIFIGLPPALERIFRLNGLEFLLSADKGV
jgi:anti-anti-sigma regulatory factor